MIPNLIIIYISIARRNQNPSPYAFANFQNPESVLINGLGRLPGGAQSPLSVVNVQPNLRYRFRLVNIACVAGFNFSIDDHKMTVIETDGTEALPTERVDVVTVWTGQRVSVIVHANESIGNYCECDFEKETMKADLDLPQGSGQCRSSWDLHPATRSESMLLSFDTRVRPMQSQPLHRQAPLYLKNRIL